MSSSSVFESAKRQLESKVDLSRKGGVDAAIQDLVFKINQHQDIFTLSSCSGRIVLFNEEQKGAKKGCNWIIVEHQHPLNPDRVFRELGDLKNVCFRFEPFVLHTRCRSLQTAAKLLAVSVESGFKNSGISVGGKKQEKFMVATRSTHTMEVPLTNQDGKVLVDEEYVSFVVKMANEKMVENERRIAKFTENLEKSFFST